MTSVERGATPDQRRGGCMNFVLTAGRVQNPKNLVDVICEHVLGKLIWMA